MKKSTQFFKAIIAICVVVMFVACSKDIDSKSGSTSSTSETKGPEPSPDQKISKPALPYTGGTTIGDSTSTKR
jgi:hypothetical protein